MTDEAVSGWKYEIHVSKETTFGKTITILESLDIRPKIKFYLFGIVTRPTEKLAVQIILFAFQKYFFYSEKSESRRNFDCMHGVCSGLYLFQISIVKALDVHSIESKRLNDIE